MDPALIIKLVLTAGIVLIVLAIGLRARPEDTLLLIRKPALGVRAMISMFVVVPLFVLFITWVLPLTQPLRTALLALSVSPMPPILPRKEAKVGGQGDYAVGLQVLAAVVSIAVVPMMIVFANRIFKVNGVFQPFAMARLLLISIGAPLAIGIAAGRLLPKRRDFLALWSGRLGTWVLILGGAAAAVATLPLVLAQIGSGALLLTLAIIAFALIVGHLLGGPDPGNRGALAVATAARHPGVAILLSTSIFPQHKAAIVGIVLLYLLANVVVTLPYMSWRKRVTRAPIAA